VSAEGKARPGGRPLSHGRRAIAKARLEAKLREAEGKGDAPQPKAVAPVRRGPWRYKGELLQARVDSVYTPVVGDAICQMLTEGMSLRTICEDEGMPSVSTVLRWVSAGELPDADPALAAFSLQYVRARLEQAEAYADATVALADDAAASEANPQLVKLQIDARKWYAGKIKPQRFGEAALLKLAGADGGALQVQLSERQSLVSELLQALGQQVLDTPPAQPLLDVTPRVVEDDQG
jgi:hypothetical protein